jgi:uncharacterized protein YlxW (UPF0749 family)
MPDEHPADEHPADEHPADEHAPAEHAPAEHAPAEHAPEHPARPVDPGDPERTVKLPAHPPQGGPDDVTVKLPAMPPQEEPGGEYEDTGSIPAVGGRQRVSSASLVIALLLGLLGFALVVQLRSNATDPGLSSARPEDLVRILSDLDSRQQRLRQEIAQLQDSQRQLASGAQGREAALEEARRRADDLGILAGTLPAAGSGLTITFTPGKDAIPAGTILDAVEELRGAGAEAMQVAGSGGGPVRVVASTYFTDVRDGLNVDGTRLGAPYTLLVIGDPQTMHTALNIPGGVVDTVHQRGGNVIVQEADTVRVTALHQAATLEYARPVS